MAIAEGNEIYRAGTTVFLTEEVHPSHIEVVPKDDSAIVELVELWELQESEE